jgi:DNA-binding MarR family transcriptional regulator
MPDSEKQTDQRVEVPSGLTNVLFDVWLVSRATTALLDEALRPSGLDADEFAVYSVLASGDGMTPSDLAQWMSAPATTVSSYVKRFESRGHVQRAPHPDDGRSYLLQLTEAGRRVHRDAGGRFSTLLDQVNRAGGADVAETSRRLRDLHQAIESLGSRPTDVAFD